MTITIPTALYCGFQKRDNAVLAFITPDGEDTASKNRKATVDKWRDDTIDPMILTNEPLSGFKMVKSIRRFGRNGGNTVVRILDPRGFELEISVENLIDIMADTDILKGEFQTSCVWGREDGKNYLLPTESSRYQEAMTPPEVKKVPKPKLIPAKELKIGDVIKLNDGTLALYGGRHNGIDLRGTNFNERPYHLIRQICDKSTVSCWISASFTSPAIEIIQRQNMTFDEFANGCTFVSGLHIGEFYNPEVSLAAVTGSLTEYPRISKTRIGKWGPGFYTCDGRNGREVTVHDGVLKTSKTTDAPSQCHMSYARYIVTYDTPTGKQTFTFR